MNMSVKSVLTAAVLAGVKHAAAAPTNDLKPSDVAAVTQEVVDAVQPTVDHLTNNEPWYQSRVTLGALLAGAAGVAGVFGYALPEEMQGKVVDAVIAAGPIIGALLTLYGRYFAKKPLGS